MKRMLYALALLLGLTLPTLDAYAQKPRTASPLEIPAGDEVDPSFYQDARRINGRTGAPEALYHVGFPVDPGTACTTGPPAASRRIMG